jgi:four helix bundle protein
MKIYEIWLVVVANVYRLAKKIQQHDKDLAQQMRRAVASGALNMSEGMYSRGGNKVARYHDSMGSARETMSCLHVCEAAEFVTRAEIEADLERIDHVIAGLYRLCHPRRA